MLNLYKTPQDGVRGSHASGAAPVKAPSPNASSGTPGSALHAAMDMEETGTGGAVVETPQRATGAGAGPGSAALQGKRGGGMPSRCGMRHACWLRIVGGWVETTLGVSGGPHAKIQAGPTFGIPAQV